MKELKKLLEERLSSIEDAFRETDRPKVNFTVYPEDMRKNQEADYNAKVIVEAARKIEKECGLGEIDWSDSSQPKWTPWFWMRPSAFAFGALALRFHVCVCGVGFPPSRAKRSRCRSYRQNIS